MVNRSVNAVIAVSVASSFGSAEVGLVKTWKGRAAAKLRVIRKVKFLDDRCQNGFEHAPQSNGRAAKLRVIRKVKFLDDRCQNGF